MLEVLAKAKLAGVYEVNMRQSPPSNPLPMNESL